MRKTITLRGGAQTLDRRLDRIAQPDVRNSEFPVRALFGAAPTQLRSYTWTVPAHFDQRAEGACVAYAIAHHAVARPRAAPVDRIAPLLADNTLYHRAQRDDPWPGGAYPGAEPQYDGTSVLAGMQAAVGLGLYSAFHWAFTEREVAEAVAYRGPVIIGVNWYAGMYETDPAGFIAPTGELLGGHATLVHGINVALGTYRIHNSWGPDWGIAGGAKLRRRDLAQLLAEPGGEACLPVRR